jgi:hypothetical protein
MTADELSAWLLDKAERLLACDDISEEHRAWLKRLLVAHSSGDPGALMRVAIPRDLCSCGVSPNSTGRDARPFEK